MKVREIAPLVLPHRQKVVVRDPSLTVSHVDHHSCISYEYEYETSKGFEVLFCKGVAVPLGGGRYSVNAVNALTVKDDFPLEVRKQARNRSTVLTNSLSERVKLISCRELV
jgi:hypothetical protein